MERTDSDSEDGKVNNIVCWKLRPQWTAVDKYGYIDNVEGPNVIEGNYISVAVGLYEYCGIKKEA